MAVRQLLGTIAPSNGASANNLTTASPFTIPAGVDSLLLFASAGSCYATCVPDVGTLAATTSSIPLPTSVLFQLPCSSQHPSGTGDYSNVLAVYNGSGGVATINVYALYA